MMATGASVMGNSYALNASLIGDRAIVVLGIAVGFLLVPSAASLAPELVNGVLLLILVGIILGNADRWLPYLTRFGTASTSAVKQK